MMIPMAVSLAFGVLFATFITLVLIPCQYVAQEDMKRLIRRLISWVKVKILGPDTGKLDVTLNNN